MRDYANVNDYTTTVRKYHKELGKYRPLTKVKEKELLSRAKKNDFFARQEILQSNLRFVFNVALGFKGKGVSMEDLISEGNYGLVKAIDKFNEKEDVKFISYAVWWVKESMRACIKKNEAKLDMEIKQDDLVITTTKSKVSEEENLDIESNETVFSDCYEVNGKELSKAKKHVVNNLLQQLSEREQFVIRASYGIDMPQMTLEDIGSEINVSKERARQIREEALRYLRTQIMLMDNIEDLW